MGDFFRHLVVRFGLVIVGLVVIGIGMLGYAVYDYNFGHHVRISIDNTSGRPIKVSLDDREIATVPAGESELVTVREGEYRVTATSGGDTVYDETHSMPKPSSGDYTNFVFNPDGQGRYWSAEMIYGQQMPFVTPQFSSIESVVQNLTKEIVLVDPPAKWNQVEADYMLEERFPDEIELPKHATSATKIGIRRLSIEDYEFVAAARKDGTKPDGGSYTEADIEALDSRVMRIFSAGEYAGQ